MELIIIIWFACAITAGVIASNRGGSGLFWFLEGAIFGPLGVLTAFTAGKKCPYCRSRISPKAIVCPKCGREIEKKKYDKWREVGKTIREKREKKAG